MKTAALAALVTLSWIAVPGDAQGARWYYRSQGTSYGSCSTCTTSTPYCSPSTSCSYGDSVVAVVVPTCTAYRQCRVAYFDCCSSAWFEADVLVPIDCAIVGVLTPNAKVPGCGKVKAWVVKVYDTPQLSPPQFAKKTD